MPHGLSSFARGAQGALSSNADTGPVLYATCVQTLLCLLKFFIAIDEQLWCVISPVVAMLGADAGLTYHVTHLHIGRV